METFIPLKSEKKGLFRHLRAKPIIFFIFLVFSVIAWCGYYYGILTPGIIEPYLIKYPLTAVCFFICLYVIVVAAAVPSLPLNLAAGFFWGGPLGGLYSAIGVTIGGWISFYTAKKLISPLLANKVDNKWVTMVQQGIHNNGLLFAIFVRINPIIPTGPLNYLLGLTPLSNKAFLCTTFPVLLPASVAVAYLGHTFQTFTLSAQELKSSEIIHNIFWVSIIATCLIGLKFASKAFKIKE